MTQQKRSENGLARSWAAATKRALSDWRWFPVLGKVGLGALALVLLSILGAGGLQSAGASPEALTVATVVSPSPTTATPASVAPGASSSALVASSATAQRGAVDCEVDAPRGVTSDGRVVLNVASASELRTLPGVGPARAAAIVALRERLGRYRRVEELLRVRGIGRRSLQKLRPLVVVDAPPAKEE